MPREFGGSAARLWGEFGRVTGRRHDRAQRAAGAGLQGHGRRAGVILRAAAYLAATGAACGFLRGLAKLPAFGIGAGLPAACKAAR